MLQDLSWLNIMAGQTMFSSISLPLVSDVSIHNSFLLFLIFVCMCTLVLNPNLRGDFMNDKPEYTEAFKRETIAAFKEYYTVNYAPDVVSGRNLLGD